MVSLAWLFAIPLVGSLLLLVLPASTLFLKRLAILLSLIPLFLLLYGGAGWSGADLQREWLPTLSISFHLHVDLLSLLFVYLTAILVPFALVVVRRDQLAFPSFLFSLILLLEALLIGFFTARDLALFTLFWEAMLLPLYFLINLWGGAQRQAAALKFLLYMIAGSTLMVAAVLALYVSSGATFDLVALAEKAPHASWIFALFLLAFAVKTPLFPFHAWLPDAYTQASTPGTILLAALLSKAGVYGILRLGLEVFPTVLQAWSPWLLGLAIAGVLYGGLAAWQQSDFKRLIAYSSFSHVNFILAGLFVWEQAAHSGAALQALNHGVTITALFLVAGWLEERLGDTSLQGVSGLAKYLPHLCWLTLFFVLASVALPGTNNFIGEILIFFGLFRESPWLAALLGLTMILSAIYMLRWMQKLYFGPALMRQAGWVDIGTKEMAIAIPLVIGILWVGLYPAPVLGPIEKITRKLEEKKEKLNHRDHRAHREVIVRATSVCSVVSVVQFSLSGLIDD